MLGRMPFLAFAVLLLGFVPAPGTVVQTVTAGDWQAVTSKQVVGQGADGRLFYQWYLTVYQLVPRQQPVFRFRSPDEGAPLSEVDRAAGGAKMWFPIQSATIVGFAKLMPGNGSQLVVEAHEASADCGTGIVSVFRFTPHGSVKPAATLHNGCSLTAAIVRGTGGALDTIALRAPYYAPNAALCCPTKPEAGATLAYRNSSWTLSPKFYQLQTPTPPPPNGVWKPKFNKWLPTLSLDKTLQTHAAPKGNGSVDFFICNNGPISSISYREFDYAISGCPLLEQGTAYSTGKAGPERGNVVYDPAHQIVLFSRGCCSVESFVLAGGIGAPPSPVHEADLTDVRTHRGLHLGMTQNEVMAIYGQSYVYSVASHPGLIALRYFTRPPTPIAACGGDAGRQNLTFAFRDNKLTYIEIGEGC